MNIVYIPIDKYMQICRRYKHTYYMHTYIHTYHTYTHAYIYIHTRTHSHVNIRNFIIIKGEGVPLHAMEAHGERRYSSYSYSTSALDGSEWSASRPGRALPPVPTVQEAGWAPEPVWTQRLEEKSSASVGDRTPVIQSVVRH
jgi:hypothetical protein